LLPAHSINHHLDAALIRYQRTWAQVIHCLTFFSAPFFGDGHARRTNPTDAFLLLGAYST
jgi:hypothetical protein